MPKPKVGADRPDMKGGNKVAPTTKAQPAPSGGHGAPGDQTNAQKRAAAKRDK